MKTKAKSRAVLGKEHAEEMAAYDRHYDPLAEALDIRAALEHERQMRARPAAETSGKKS